MEESMVSKTFLKVIGLGASIMLTVFAGIFALVSIACLVCSIVEQDFLAVAGSAASGFLAWMMWSIRKDTLV